VNWIAPVVVSDELVYSTVYTKGLSGWAILVKAGTH